jgi:hypothetical protein
MTKNQAKYKDGRHWVLDEDAVYETNIIGYRAVTDFVCLNEGGQIFLGKHYATDGITGITGYPWEKLIARNWLRNNCWHHDGFYQLMRLGLLPIGLKDEVDKELRRTSIRDGAWVWQADAVYFMVSKYGSVADKWDHPVIIVP